MSIKGFHFTTVSNKDAISSFELNTIAILINMTNSIRLAYGVGSKSDELCSKVEAIYGVNKRHHSVKYDEYTDRFYYNSYDNYIIGMVASLTMEQYNYILRNGHIMVQRLDIHNTDINKYFSTSFFVFITTTKNFYEYPNLGLYAGHFEVVADAVKANMSGLRDKLLLDISRELARSGSYLGDKIRKDYSYYLSDLIYDTCTSKNNNLGIKDSYVIMSRLLTRGKYRFELSISDVITPKFIKQEDDSISVRGLLSLYSEPTEYLYNLWYKLDIHY